jgi:hypothetical protein
MSDTDKKLRELIIDKFMGTSRTVIANYSVNSETGEEGSIVTPKQQNIIKSPSIEETDNIETAETYLEDEEEEEEEEQEEEEETHYYLKDSPLSREFVLDPAKTDAPQLALCLYRMNTEGKKPFLEFFCKKENSIYSFPITDLNIEQMKTFLPVVAAAAVAEELVPPIEEEKVPPTEEEPLVQEQAPLVETEAVPTTEGEQPVVPIEPEPVVPMEGEQPVVPMEQEEPVVPIEQEPVVPMEQEEPIVPIEQEPIVPMEQEEPVVPMEQEEPPTDQEPVLPTEQKEPPKMVPIQQGGEEYDEITNLFFEQCSQYFQKITGLSGETASDKYKGYISLADNKHIAVFDATDLEMEPQEESIWATLYEIIDKKHILDIPVAEFTHKTFSENPVMKYIINQTGAAIDIPIVVYMCQENGGSYDNSYYSEEESRDQTESIINYRVSHPVLGYCFLFTTEPFEHNNLSKIKRFSLFTIDTIYLLNKDRDLSEYQDLDLHDYETLCFYENSAEYWAVDSSDQFLEL